ncbi:MAG: DUF1559 domain-containing protein [Thermoguttaceae bacterium]
MSIHRCRTTRASGRGFSLVELLVVISIIGVLLGLLLPAVQAARSSARRISCCNNLRQMGVGLHNYHGAHKSFPQGSIEMRLLRLPNGQLRFPGGRQLAWSVFLLPYIEENALFERLDISAAFDSPENAEAAAQIVPTYLCPSVPRTSYLVDGRAACDYGGIYGERITSPNNPPKGTMLYDRAIRVRNITDGTSHTLIISEDAGWKDGQWINGLNVFDQAYRINRAPGFENDIRSEHANGANGLFADGSVRFLEEAMELETLAAICTRAGGEIVAGF